VSCGDANILQGPTSFRKLLQHTKYSHGLNNSSLPIKRAKAGERLAPIKTQARSATILPNFVGLKFQIHDGKNYQDITITEDMVGHKLGEFAPYASESPRRISGRRCALHETSG
jgi:ribosomal protein S19